MPFPFWLVLVDDDAVSAFLLGWSEVVDDSTSQSLVNPMLRSDYCLNQESTGGSNKRDHSRANRTGNAISVQRQVKRQQEVSAREVTQETAGRWQYEGKGTMD